MPQKRSRVVEEEIEERCFIFVFQNAITIFRFHHRHHHHHRQPLHGLRESVPASSVVVSPYSSWSIYVSFSGG
jgi:hypothetical protein